MPSPDTLEADSAVEILAFLEKESAVWQLAHSSGHEDKLAWVTLEVAHVVHDAQHDEDVDHSNDRECVKDYSENVDDLSLQTSLLLHLNGCKIVVRVESVNDQSEECDNWVDTDDGDH